MVAIESPATAPLVRHLTRSAAHTIQELRRLAPATSGAGLRLLTLAATTGSMLIGLAASSLASDGLVHVIGLALVVGGPLALITALTATADAAAKAAERADSIESQGRI